MLMDESFWDKLAAQEDAQTEGTGTEFYAAYDDNEYLQAQSDDEGPTFDDYGEEDDFDDYHQDAYDSGPEFGFSYTQLQHVSFGDPEIGTSISGGGKLSKLEKMIQQQTVSKEKLYTNKLKAELMNYFSNFDEANFYATIAQRIPRFWLKNVGALAAVLFMHRGLKGNKLTTQRLVEYSAQTGYRKEDLLRYFRLLSEYA